MCARVATGTGDATGRELRGGREDEEQNDAMRCCENDAMRAEASARENFDANEMCKRKKTKSAPARFSQNILRHVSAQSAFFGAKKKVERRRRAGRRPREDREPLGALFQGR